MYSYLHSVPGFDRTHIRRLTYEAYLTEMADEEQYVRWRQSQHQTPIPMSPSGTLVPQTTGALEYERRRAAPISRDPNVVFTARYPTHDRFGRELSVALQRQDAMVAREVARLRRDGDAARASTVRISAELPLPSPSTSPHQDHREQQQQQQQMRAHGHGDGGSSEEDVTISTMSRVSSLAPSRVVSARTSEFSIYRDSARPPLMLARSARRVRSEPPCGTSGALKTRQELSHATTTTEGGRALTPPPRGGQLAYAGAKRARDTLRHASGGRLSRIRFADEYDSEQGNDGKQPPQQHPQAEGGDGKAMLKEKNAVPNQRERDPSEPPVLVPPTTETEAQLGMHADPVARFTVARDSLAARITKQLFRGTISTLGRGTTTLVHAHPIPSSLYGLQAATIAAHKVAAAVEQNFAACSVSSGTFASQLDTPAPELRSGRVLQLGGRWFQLTAFLLVADVYEAVEVDAPAEVIPAAEAATDATDSAVVAKEEQPPSTSTSVQTEDGAKTDESAGAAPKAVVALPAEDHAEKAGRAPPASTTGTIVATEPEKASQRKEDAGTPQSVSILPAAKDAPRRQHLLYRWRSRHISHIGDEARRAAVGMYLSAPEVCVSGFTYAGGDGLTLLTMPAGFRAIPMSSLPLTPGSFTAMLKTTLQTLSGLVARRVVHGNLASLGEMLLAFPENGSQAAAGNEGGEAMNPSLIVPVHWERAVDFSMFVDRNAGRTVPYDTEDGSGNPLLTLGRDVSTVLRWFLEHSQAAALTSKQYLLLQKLIVMASEPTQVANYLIEMNNLSISMHANLSALRHAYDAAVVF